MGEVKKTISSIFMVPTVGLLKEIRDANGYLNAYSEDRIKNEPHEDCVYVLFRPNNLDKFREFLDSEYERTKDLICDYDYPNNLIILVYKLNPRFKADFHLIKMSRYSKTSPEFQALFPKVIKYKTEEGLQRDELTLQVRIFKKTPDLRKFWEDKFDVSLPDDIEVWEGYHLENEILTEEKLKEYE